MSNIYRTQNPATGETLATFETATDEEVKATISKSHAEYQTWSSKPMSDRGAILKNLADLIEENVEELANQATLEMGKPIHEAIAEVKYSAQIVRYYATQGEYLAADQELKDVDGTRAILRRRPIGVLLGIMPWNFPYYQIVRFMAPNLMLGNTVILKPAEICAGSALKLEHLIHKAGVPEGAYQNVFASHDLVAEIIADSRVQGVSLTGSERAGSAVAEQAGRHLKKVVLELGGSDAYIVLDSSDVREAARHALDIRLRNMGQSCVSNKRLIVMDSIYEEFVDELVNVVSELVPGDPRSDRTGYFAPLSSEPAADLLVQQIRDSEKAGAVVRVGGVRIDRPGYYVAPTVITDIPRTARAYSEELFGPVAMVYSVESEADAIRLANESEFGLGASVFSEDPEIAYRVAQELDVGMSHVNAYNVAGADLPFGGIKRSGYGRELGPLGMDEFVNKQLLTITD